MTRRWLVPLGTRPEIVKLAPVVAAMRAAGLPVHTVATGQHYDADMTDTFFADLGLAPDERWSLEADEATRAGEMLSLAYRACARDGVDAVLALGDTATVPAFALAARRFGVPFVHLEAGLRSYNERSVEEGNRRVATALAALHLAPTDDAAARLRSEGVAPDRVVVVGNPVTDSLRTHGPPPLPVGERSGALVTVHRPTNVDDPDRLAEVVALVRALGCELGPVRLPLHPRTRARLGPEGVHALSSAAGVHVGPPLPYAAMLDAIRSARVVVTDSGGLQEEASWYGVPAVVLRNTTPRWETVGNGSAVLVGTDGARALAAARAFAEPEAQERVARLACPFGDGFVGPRVAQLLRELEFDARLQVSDPPRATRPPSFSGAPA